jgi:hypothetical protein
MRSLTLAGAAFLLGTLMTGCGSESGTTADNAFGFAADATDRTTNHVWESNLVEETVVNPCNGETIQFTGTGVGQGNFVDVAGNNLHREFHAVISETGTGQTTGATYILHANYHEVFDSPTGPAPNFTFGIQDRGHVISSTPELSFTWLYTIHFLATAGGDFKITKDIEGDDSPIFTCRG